MRLGDGAHFSIRTSLVGNTVAVAARIVIENLRRDD